jgi:hypothetical protein
MNNTTYIWKDIIATISSMQGLSIEEHDRTTCMTLQALALPPRIEWKDNGPEDKEETTTLDELVMLRTRERELVGTT